MEWLQGSDYWLTRLLFTHVLAGLYAIAFAVTINQFRPLLGEDGLLPVPRFVAQVPFRYAPSLFHFRYSDQLLLAVAWSGLALSLALAIGLADLAPAWISILAWLLIWLLYLSIVNVGQAFYGFGWESLLLEMGALSAFFGAGRMTPPVILIYLLRWTLFRLEFGAGLIKLRGDRCWRDLTCLYYHHETQPMPNPLSWYFHHLPRLGHRLEVAGSHFTQLVVPFALFAPEPVAAAAGAIIFLSQTWLILSGNFAWLNFATLALSLTAVDDSLLARVLPFKPAHLAPLPVWWAVLSVALGALVLMLSYAPVRNLLSRRQAMNLSFNPFHFINAYGAFGAVTKIRNEIVIEGSDGSSPDGGGWKEYEFKGKPGGPRRRPPQIAPYHLRLDWLMWFAAMDSPLQHSWFLPLLVKLLQGDRALLRLLGRNPFPERPPTFVRARLYRYRFTGWRERRESGAWWSRSLVGDYFPAVRLERASGLIRRVQGA